MTIEPVVSRRVLTLWIILAVIAFLASLFFMTRGNGKDSGRDTVGPNSFSRSAIGHAGFAEILRNLNIPILKSRYDSRARLGAGGVLVIAEPAPVLGALQSWRPLLDAKTILLVLPKRSGSASTKRADWLGTADLLPAAAAQVVLTFATPQTAIRRQPEASAWTTNLLGPLPTITPPVQLIASDRLRPIVANEDGILVGAIESGGRRIWVLSDPDIIANHGITEGSNAEFGVALIDALRGTDGKVVFDETVHGFVSEPANPLKLLFTFPYIFATLQGVLAVALLLWATVVRFGAPEPLPPPLRAGKYGLIQNAARLLEFAGHQKIIVLRYVEAMIRDVAHQLHAPPGLSGKPLLAWLRRIADARGVGIDCAEISRRADHQAETEGRDLGALVPIARDIHRWKEEMLDGTAGNLRPH